MSKETTWAWLLEPLMASVQELELVLKPHESFVSGGFILILNILILLTHVVSAISDSIKFLF
jgi:hypothetical protein